MTEILGDYAAYIASAEQAIGPYGVQLDELTQCDMLNYECNTNERYDEVKKALAGSARLLNEVEHGGRLISIFQADPALAAGNWRVPYIELLQPKPTRTNIDGIDSVFFVTAIDIQSFVAKHQDIDFETKGLTNTANPYVELKTDDVAIKFHDRHMGAVLQIEKQFPAE